MPLLPEEKTCIDEMIASGKLPEHQSKILSEFANQDLIGGVAFKKKESE